MNRLISEIKNIKNIICEVTLPSQRLPESKIKFYDWSVGKGEDASQSFFFKSHSQLHSKLLASTPLTQLSYPRCFSAQAATAIYNLPLQGATATRTLLLQLDPLSYNYLLQLHPTQSRKVAKLQSCKSASRKAVNPLIR